MQISTIGEAFERGGNNFTLVRRPAIRSASTP